MLAPATIDDALGFRALSSLRDGDLHGDLALAGAAIIWIIWVGKYEMGIGVLGELAPLIQRRLARRQVRPDECFPLNGGDFSKSGSSIWTLP